MKKLPSTFLICGSCVAYYIGAGFATMQETFQYQGSYGSKFWIVIAVEAIIFTYTCISFVVNGKRHNLSRGGEVFKAYCGNYVGAFFDYFAAFFCYLSFIVMCGGANSTAMQQWGFPNGAGAIILAIAAIGTVLLGLDRIVSFLGRLAPILVISIILVAAFAIINPSTGIAQGFAAVDSGKYPLIQVGDGNPVLSGISEGGYVLLWYAAFLSEIGAASKGPEAKGGVLLSVVVIFGTCALVCTALCANIDTVWNADVPALVMADAISPIFGGLFTIIIFAGIYTSAVPLLWTGVRKVANPSSTMYKVLTILLGIGGCCIACYVPYAPLLNIVYGLNGYLGFLLVAFMIYKDIRFCISKS